MKTSTIILFFAILSQSLQAQLINIEKKRRLNQEGFSGVVQLGGRWTENVNSILTVENYIGLQYSKRAHTIMVFNDMNLIRVNKNNLANNGYRHLRYSYTLRDSSAYTFEVFGQHQNDVIKKLDNRIVAGAGPRFRFFNKPNAYIYFAPLLMFEHEKFTDYANPTFDVVKWDIYLVTSVKLWDRLAFNTITYYQPQVDKMSRYRLSHESGVEFPIFKKLSFMVSFSLQYDSYPAPDVPALFSDYRNTLRYSF